MVIQEFRAQFPVPWMGAKLRSGNITEQANSQEQHFGLGAIKLPEWKNKEKKRVWMSLMRIKDWKY